MTSKRIMPLLPARSEREGLARQVLRGLLRFALDKLARTSVRGLRFHPPSSH